MGGKMPGRGKTGADVVEIMAIEMLHDRAAARTWKRRGTLACDTSDEKWIVWLSTRARMF
jgi:hypothetical protein